MMKKKINLLFLLASLIFVNSPHVFAEAASAKIEAMQASIGRFMRDYEVPGIAVQVYMQGEPHSFYYGYANKEKQTPVTVDTIFDLGSVSKVMTNLLFAQQVDYAKAGFDDAVSKYLNQAPESFNHITLKELATHTAGFSFDVPDTIKTKTALNDYFKTWSPKVAPKSQWIYSNIGIGLLGFVLESQTQKSLDTLYDKNILSPLKITSQVTSSVPKRLKKNYAQGYDSHNQATHSQTPMLFPAAWGIKMRAGDMQPFLSAATGLPGTPEHILYPMWMTQSVFVKLPDRGEGLGWEIHTITNRNIKTLLSAADANPLIPCKVEEMLVQPLFNGNALIDKAGATAGFRAYVAVIPYKKAGVMILTNKYVSTRAITALGREILFNAANVS